jgi:hypothetical protein
MSWLRNGAAPCVARRLPEIPHLKNGEGSVCGDPEGVATLVS